MSIWGYKPSQCVSLVSRHVICTIHKYFSADEIGPQIKQHLSRLYPLGGVCVAPFFFFFISPSMCLLVYLFICVQYIFMSEYKYPPPPLLKQRVMDVFEKSTIAGSEWKHFKETLHSILAKKKKENKDSAPVHKESITAGWPGGDRDHHTKPEITSLCRQAVPR